MMKKPNRDYFNLFLTVAACIVFYFVISHLSEVGSFFARMMRVFSPILYGFVIAYLLNPAMKFFNRLLDKAWKKKAGSRSVRALSLILTYLFALLVIAAILLIVVPQTVESVSTLANNFSTYSANFSQWLRRITEMLEENFDSDFLNENLETITGSVQGVISRAASGLVEALPGLVTFLSGLTSTLSSLLFGMFLSIYMLFDKENLVARLKKTCCTMFRPSTARRIILFFRDTNETVGDFINGKILDSFIIGVLSYVVYLIFGLPYAALLAVITGILNIIPLFGPIIGAAINALLLVMVSPRQVIPFLIIIIVIQQIDGNILGPKIIGKATGLSGFWVMVALTVGGGLFGLAGMVLSVPVFTVLYRAFSHLVNTALSTSGLPSDTAYYVDYPPREAPVEGAGEKKSFSAKKLFQRFGKKKKTAEFAPQEPPSAEEALPEAVEAMGATEGENGNG